MDLTGVLLGYLGWNFCFGVWNELRDGEKHREGKEGEKEGARGLIGFIEAGFKFPGLCWHFFRLLPCTKHLL